MRNFADIALPYRATAMGMLIIMVMILGSDYETKLPSLESRSPAQPAPAPPKKGLLSTLINLPGNIAENVLTGDLSV
jgi:hypothetical protein